jgi:hypothetical protein
MDGGGAEAVARWRWRSRSMRAWGACLMDLLVARGELEPEARRERLRSVSWRTGLSMLPLSESLPTDPYALTSAWSALTGCPAADPRTLDYDPAAAALAPETQWEAWRLLPVRLEGDSLVALTHGPASESAIARAEDALGRELNALAAYLPGGGAGVRAYLPSSVDVWDEESFPENDVSPDVSSVLALAPYDTPPYQENHDAPE